METPLKIRYFPLEAVTINTQPKTFDIPRLSLQLVTRCEILKFCLSTYLSIHLFIHLFNYFHSVLLFLFIITPIYFYFYLFFFSFFFFSQTACRGRIRIDLDIQLLVQHHTTNLHNMRGNTTSLSEAGTVFSKAVTPYRFC